MGRPRLLRKRFHRYTNIDQLAKDGRRFTDFYAAGAVCSPTRCAVQSGQNQARIGITGIYPVTGVHSNGSSTPDNHGTSSGRGHGWGIDEASGLRYGIAGKGTGRGDKFGPDKQAMILPRKSMDRTYRVASSNRSHDRKTCSGSVPDGLRG